MKSIKEKAEEYSFIKQGIAPSGIQYRDFNIDKQEGFEAGANYVLECIEQLIYEKHVEGSLPLFDLTHLINKLKEK